MCKFVAVDYTQDIMVYTHGINKWDPANSVYGDSMTNKYSSRGNNRPGARAPAHTPMEGKLRTGYSIADTRSIFTSDVVK